MTLDEINRYYNQLVNHLNDSHLFSISNSDRAHNSTVMRFMFDHCPDINMFCGEMSVLRHGFYEQIKNEHSDDIANEVKELLKESLKRFIENPNHKLKIIIANLEKFSFSDLILKTQFISGVSKGIIELYHLDNRFILADSLKHCTYSNVRVVRMEVDQDSHKAICSVSIDQTLLDMLNYNFQKMLSASKPIQLSLN